MYVPWRFLYLDWGSKDLAIVSREASNVPERGGCMKIITTHEVLRTVSSREITVMNLSP